MSSRLLVRSAVTLGARRRAGGHGHSGAPHTQQTPVTKNWQPQTPSGFIHDGWASARLPFHVYNKWGFAAKAITFLALGFWAPFFVVEYQLRKARAN